jgi:SAM-dependent methyltransferase
MVWDALSAEYLDKVFCVIQFPEKRRRILEVVKRGTVLDLGCGPTGFLLRDLIADRSRKVIGSDISHSMLLAARQSVGPAAHFVRADNRDLPFPDACLDTVVSVNSIVPESRGDVLRMVSEALRILRNAGRLVAVLPAFETSVMARDHWPLEVRVDEPSHREYETSGWQCFHTADDIRDLMAALGISKYTLERLLFVEALETAVIRHVYSPALSDDLLRKYPLFEHLLVAEKPHS